MATSEDGFTLASRCFWQWKSEMVPKPTDRLFEATRRHLADREPDAGGEITSIGADPPTAAADEGTRRAERDEAVRKHGRRRRASPARQLSRRLGPLEYTLLVLIALGIVITITMAVVNPSG